MTISETGHLVFATLHTSTAAETIDRIIDVFPAHQQGQIRQQLAATVKVVASQRLLPAVGGGRVAALEIMIANPAIRNLIREGKSHQIDSVIQTQAESGMMMFENHLQQLVQRNAITPEVAMAQSSIMDVSIWVAVITGFAALWRFERHPFWPAPQMTKSVH